jgi:glycerol-3-phosphate dehydrogenase
VGGGISGICAAWEAALRGLSVALIEGGDFAHAASANCFKMIHGGIRYLQHGDLPRVRESAAERRTLLRIAPHLARPLPIFVPTYGHGLQGKALLAAGMKIYDAVTVDRNRGVRDPEARIVATRLVSRREALERFPFLDGPGFSGGAVFHDGQMHSPARLALAFLQSAAARGARVANYVAATRLLRSGDRVVGAAARDELGGDELEIRARVVLNATGGWAPRWLREALGLRLDPEPAFSRDACFVVRRQVDPEYGIAVSGRTSDPDALLSRAARHLFLVPWRDCTLVGVWHVVYEGDPARARVEEAELEAFLDEVNAGCPALELRREDVALTQCGLVLFGDNQPGVRNLSYGKRSRFIDHAQADRLPGLMTLIGVRYTTARADAERVVNRVFRELGRSGPRSRSATTPLHGGDFERFEDLEREARASHADLPLGSLRGLLHGHGTEYRRVLLAAAGRPELARPLPGSTVLGAEVVHAARAEMAMRLDDVVFRRTELGNGGSPGYAGLEAAAALLAGDLGWSASRQKEELERTLAMFPAEETARP